MTQRQKLEFAINTPTEITLLYDEPIVGHSQYGVYNLYAVEAGGVEYSLFAPEIVHEQLKQLSKGQSAIITKLAAQRGNKVVTTYDVVMPKRAETVPPDDNTQFSDFDNSSQPQQTNSAAEQDSTYRIMLSSLRDAIAISKELNGLIDANKIGITLFIARSKSNSYGG